MAAINSGNALTSGLAFALDPSTATELVTGSALTFFGSARPAVSLARNRAIQSTSSSADGAKITTGSALKAVTGDFTISVLVSSGSAGLSYWLCAPYGSGWATPFTALAFGAINGLNGATVQIATGASTQVTATSDNQYFNEYKRQTAWYTVVRSGSTVTFYRNGIQFGATKTLAGTIDWSSNTETDLMNRHSASVGNGMNGTLDSAFVWNRALAAADVKSLFGVDGWRSLLTPAPAKVAEVVGGSVFVDTDFAGDCDDVLAVQMLLTAERRGDCRIIGANANSGNPKAPGAIDVLAKWNGHSGIPISGWKGTSPDNADLFASAMYDNFPHDVGTGAAVTDSTVNYRTVLAAQPDASVSIVSLGYLNALEALRTSPADGISSLTGAQLLAAKVTQIVCMGGNYPSGSEANLNNATTRANSSSFIANSPVPIRFAGFEVGGNIYTGYKIQEVWTDPATSPLRRAWDNGQTPWGRQSYDPIASMLFLKGARDWFIEVPGTNVVNSSTGANTFTPGLGGPHSFIVAPRTLVEYAAAMEEMLVADRRESGIWSRNSDGGRTKVYASRAPL